MENLTNSEKTPIKGQNNHHILKAKTIKMI